MSLPGFTAEAALTRTRNHAFFERVAADYSDSGMIAPQEMKCSDDGRLCLDCYYDSQGRLLYCDVIWLPPLRTQEAKMSNFSF
jgi:hypothetical protein